LLVFVNPVHSWVAGDLRANRELTLPLCRTTFIFAGYQGIVSDGSEELRGASPLEDLEINMQFQGKITEEDLNDVRKMTVSKMYWPRLLLANWYGLALILALIWATISGLFGGTNPNWRFIAIFWAVLGGIVLWVVYSTKRTMAREFSQLNATLPDHLNLTTDGVKIDGPNGASAFLPWRTFKGWREGRRVVLIDQSQGNSVVILPVAQLSEIERLSIRQYLQSHIPVML
jgi:hypothetical protein